MDLITALREYERPEKDTENLIVALEQSVRDYLLASPQPLTQSRAEALRQEIESAMPFERQEKPIATLVDMDADNQPNLLVGLPWMFGVPALAFLAGDGYAAVPLPPDYDQASETNDFIRSDWVKKIETKDVTGDGKAETIITY